MGVAPSIEAHAVQISRRLSEGGAFARSLTHDIHASAPPDVRAMAATYTPTHPELKGKDAAAMLSVLDGAARIAVPRLIVNRRIGEAVGMVADGAQALTIHTAKPPNSSQAALQGWRATHEARLGIMGVGEYRGHTVYGSIVIDSRDAHAGNAAGKLRKMGLYDRDVSVLDAGLPEYGSTGMVLHNRNASRTTVTRVDSLHDLQPSDVATMDRIGDVLIDTLTESQLEELLRANPSKASRQFVDHLQDLGRAHSRSGNYVEIQVRGGMSAKDIAELRVQAMPPSSAAGRHVAESNNHLQLVPSLTESAARHGISTILV